MAQFTPIDPASDVVSTTTKVTTGYFSGGRGELAGSNFATKSLDSCLWKTSVHSYDNEWIFLNEY